MVQQGVRVPIVRLAQPTPASFSSSWSTFSLITRQNCNHYLIFAASSTAHKLDKLALNCLDTLEHKIPAIQKSPTQIVTNVKKGASSAIHTGVRRVMKTYPGQKVVKGIDSMIMWSETTIHSSDAEGCDEDGQVCSEKYSDFI